MESVGKVRYMQKKKKKCCFEDEKQNEAVTKRKILKGMKEEGFQKVHHKKKKKKKCCFEVVINSYQLINSNQFLFMFSLKMRY